MAFQYFYGGSLSTMGYSKQYSEADNDALTASILHTRMVLSSEADAM